ncbi:MAG: hypothetical protein IJT94_11945 [Oscillibacter sp.]|nr:hypothetical protein [Oscillibacter sp.]
MDMETREQIEPLVQRLDCAACLLFTIHMAMDRNIFDAKSFAPALNGTYEYLTAQITQLRNACQGTKT